MLRPPTSVLLNLFLAVIPVFLAFVIAHGARRDMRTMGRVRLGLWLPLGVVWLVFLPNSCYLLTEWRHYLETLTRSPLYAQAHQSRDGQLDFFITTGFYLFYSGAGLLAFFLAIWPLDRLTRRRLGWGGALLRPLIFPLCALGVYLGLTRSRFNSWDLVNAQKLTPMLAMTGQVFHRPLALSMILLFGAVLWLFYAAFDIWMDGAAWRLNRRHAREKDSSHASA